jgi:hypothetical protein
MRTLALKPNHKRIAAHRASLTDTPSPLSSAMRLGCRIAYYDVLWEPEAWSRQARQLPMAGLYLRFQALLKLSAAGEKDVAHE